MLDQGSGSVRAGEPNQQGTRTFGGAQPPTAGQLKSKNSCEEGWRWDDDGGGLDKISRHTPIQGFVQCSRWSKETETGELPGEKNAQVGHVDCRPFVVAKHFPRQRGRNGQECQRDGWEKIKFGAAVANALKNSCRSAMRFASHEVDVVALADRRNGRWQRSVPLPKKEPGERASRKFEIAGCSTLKARRLGTFLVARGEVPLKDPCATGLRPCIHRDTFLSKAMNLIVSCSLLLFLETKQSACQRRFLGCACRLSNPLLSTCESCLSGQVTVLSYCLIGNPRLWRAQLNGSSSCLASLATQAGQG